MPEYFELTFFLDKSSVDNKIVKQQMLGLLSLHDGKQEITEHQFSLFSYKEVLFDVFEYDEVDFLEYRICLADFYITKRSLDAKVNQLLQIVDLCFKQIDAIRFATGIYELTYYYIEGIKRLKDFDIGVLSKFPLLFLRAESKCDFTPTYLYGSTACIYNNHVQNIYSDPTRQLMEDYGMSIEDAMKSTDIQEQ